MNHLRRTLNLSLKSKYFGSTNAIDANIYFPDVLTSTQPGTVHAIFFVDVSNVYCGFNVSCLNGESLMHYFARRALELTQAKP